MKIVISPECPPCKNETIRQAFVSDRKHTRRGDRLSYGKVLY